MLILGMSNVLSGLMLLPSPGFLVGLYVAWFAAIVLLHVGMEVRRFLVARGTIKGTQVNSITDASGAQYADEQQVELVASKLQ